MDSDRGDARLWLRDGSPVHAETKTLRGFDALLATVQMPGGIPVGTLGVGRSGAKNAGLLAAAILAGRDPALRKRLEQFREAQAARVPERPTDG